MEFTKEYYVGWFTLALINAGLAQSKGRSGLFWGLLSMFGGPVITAILLFLSDRRLVR